MRKELITIKGVRTKAEAYSMFIKTYCRWVPFVSHYAPIDAIDLMNKIEFELVQIKKRGIYKPIEKREFIFLAKYSYGR